MSRRLSVIVPVDTLRAVLDNLSTADIPAQLAALELRLALHRIGVSQ